MTFSMTQVAADGSESTPSNLLVFDPNAYPELFSSKLVTFTWDYNGTADTTGFRVYQNGVAVCETTDPTARQLACTVDINSSTVTYTLTAVNADGTQTNLSNALTYTADTTADNTELHAVLTTNTQSGPAPLSVGFNASSSTGQIATYQWDFGDGSSATGKTISHSYTTAGAYTAKLTVANSAGQTSTAFTTITATASTTPVPVTPPTAVLSSSTAAGPAPLTVNFNGSGSTAASTASIASYSWSFGDGSSATGASAAHTFTAAGTYSTTLTVTDSKGLTSSTSTPIVVTAPVVTTNKPPTAVATATATSGIAPLAVTFDGSASTDTDGTISSYVWNFGDGSSATGKTVTHTFLNEATLIATLQVTDNKGAKNTTNITITVNPALNIELGEVAVTDKWIRVPLTSTFENPIVVAGPPSYNGGDPCVIRLRNVTKTGFDIRLAEWNYLDGAHVAETVNYLVLEKGRTTLPNGSIVEAGSFTGTTSFKTTAFSKAFTRKPVVITTVASENEPDTISGRIRAVGLTSFAYYFREQEKNRNTHANETVNFIAWEPGKGTVGSIQFEAATTALAVTNAWFTPSFKGSYNQPPLLLADMQTTQNTDTSALRVQNTTATDFQVKVEEEKSKDTEVAHPAEAVGYLVIDKAE